MDVVPGGVVQGSSFFGRTGEVSRIWDGIERRRNLLLVSPRRVGKTSLLHHLVDQPKSGWTVVYVDLQIVADPIAAIEHILDGLKTQGGVGGSIWKSFVEKLESIENVKIGLDGAALSLRQAASRRWESTTKAFSEALLASGAKGHRLLLIVDEFPILIKALIESGKKREAEDMLRLFRFVRLSKELQTSFRMIVCGSIGLKPVLRRHKMSGDANDLKDFRLGPWNEATARAFLAAIGVARPNLAFPPAIHDEILACTGVTPLPYHVQAILSQLEDLAKPPASITVDDVRAARDAALRDAEFDHYFERLEAVFEVDDLELALHVLALLSTRSDADIATIEALPIGQADLKGVLRTLLEDGYIAEQNGSTGRTFLFSNPMLKAYWALTHG